MILQALHAYYDILLEDPESGVAMPGYSAEKVSHVLVLNTAGDLVDIYPLFEIKGKKSVPKTLLLPERAIRKSGINANYLGDNVSYVIGQESKDDQRQTTSEKFSDFQQKNLAFLQGISGDEAQALTNFLSTWKPEKAPDHAVLGPRLKDLLKGYNLVFKLDGALGFVHEAPEIIEAWEARSIGGIVEAESTNSDSEETKSREDENREEVWGQCLITGQRSSIARIHNSIKGVAGAQAAGAALVSFNIESFKSYGKKQNYNAPISKSAAFAYTTALNYLLASDNHHMRLPDMTAVFWADKRGAQQENAMLAWTLDPVVAEENEDADSKKDREKAGRRVDPATAREAKKILNSIRLGKPVEDLTVELDVCCYVLGLAPNAARLAVRFWQVNTLGDIMEKIARHYADMDIVGLERWGGMVPPYRTLKALAVQEDAKNVPPQLGGQFLESILTGCMYPQTLYRMALSRCRTGGEHGGTTPVRAAVIKAFLLRQYRKAGMAEKKKEAIHMSLNENHPSPAYQLGRLFSLLEKAQRDALGPKINATIRDRYFGSASTTPGAVFPLLLKLTQHHMAKPKYGDESGRKIRDYLDPKVRDVLNRLDAEVFPPHLNLEEQGLFILGYYHQNHANYPNKDTKAGADENAEIFVEKQI